MDEKEVYKAVVDSSSDAIITKNLDGIVTSWNRAAERIFGYTAAEMIGRSITTLIPTDHLNEEPKIIARLKKGEMIDHYETIRQRKDGTLIEISLTVSPVKDKNGIIVGASKIARDIGKQKEYERKLIDQATELEQFAYVASHDLQEPLRKIALYIQMLESRIEARLDSESKRYIEKVVNSSRRMKRLIEDLLSYSRANKMEVKEEVDLNQTVKNVLGDLEAIIRETGAKISFEGLPKIRANAFQMHQLLQNLIGNAIKFHGMDSPVIDVSAYQDKNTWVISVKDNGIGVEPQYHEQIFKVFHRLHGQDTYPGTGIGLAVCKKILEHHGGKIWVNSSRGKGATFRFTLPVGNISEK